MLERQERLLFVAMTARWRLVWLRVTAGRDACASAIGCPCLLLWACALGAQDAPDDQV